MELDWERKARDLKEMSQELDLWAHKSQGREKLVLGRVSDELKRLADQINYLLRESDDDLPFHRREIPDWLADPVEFESDEYNEDEEYWDDAADETYDDVEYDE